MVQAAIFECLLNLWYLILADRLELLKERLDIVALLFEESLEEVPLGWL